MAELSKHEVFGLIHEICEEWIAELSNESLELQGKLDSFKHIQDKEQYIRATAKIAGTILDIEEKIMLLEYERITCPIPVDETQVSLQGFIIRLENDELFREEQEQLCELMRTSMLKAKAKLSEWHVYCNSEVDKPLLNSETYSEYE